jgi:hypothetical protein
VTISSTAVSRRERAVSGLAGASGGLGLVSIANSLPASMAPIPALLIYVSPFATILLSSVWAVAIVKSRRWLRRRGLQVSLRSAVRLRDEVFASRQSSPIIRKQAQSSVERIQALVMELILEDTKDDTTLLDFVPTTLPTAPRGRSAKDAQNSTEVHNS